MSSSSSSSTQPAAPSPNTGYELSGKIMLSAIVILFAVVIFMVCLHLYARWYLIRARRRQLHRRNRNRRQNIVFYVDAASANSHGLDPAVLKSLPVFVFDGGESECAVCLSEFEQGEKGRSLPKCNHSFHLDCIDMWFTSHSTCPLCRAPVELADEQIQVVVVDSVTETEAGASSALDLEPATAISSLDSKAFSIEIPARNNELTETDSPQAFKSPGGRMMSLRRILSRGLSGVSGSSGCCDLETETGIRDEPDRTQTTR